MLHFLPEAMWAILFGVSMVGGAYLSAALGMIVSFCLLAALQTHAKNFDRFDRIFVAGLAGSMLLTTPALFFHAESLEGWSFNLSRFFLAGIAIKRYGVPFMWSVLGSRRQAEQIASSGRQNAWRDGLDGRL